MSPTVATMSFKQATRRYWATIPFCVWPWQKTKSLAENTYLFWNQSQEEFWWLKKVQYLQQKYHRQWTFLRGKKRKRIIHNLGNLLRPLESIPVSRERVKTTAWQVRTILGDCISKARVITVQAPQYRQHALISDFLDLANLSVQEEAALATNWIDDRPEGVKASEPCVSHHSKISDEQFSEKIRLRTSRTLSTNANLWA